MSAAIAYAAPRPSIRFSSGGVLWREFGDGIEVCLVRGHSGLTIPRGPIEEDERVADAAVQRVYERTGLRGHSPRKLHRAEFVDGEIAWFHALRAPRRDAPRLSAGTIWVPIATALDLVSGPERAALEQLRATPPARASASGA